MNVKVYELRVKLYTLKDIPVEDMLSIESDYIDSALALSDEWLTYHENTGYKMYTFNGLFPLERSGIYKKDSIYTMTPPITLMQRISLAPVLSATLSLVSCCTIILPLSVISILLKNCQNYLALLIISTNLHLLSLDKGLVSITLTTSPIKHSLFSSWAFNLYVLFTILL